MQQVPAIAVVVKDRAAVDPPRPDVMDGARSVLAAFARHGGSWGPGDAGIVRNRTANASPSEARRRDSSGSTPRQRPEYDGVPPEARWARRSDSIASSEQKHRYA